MPTPLRISRRAAVRAWSKLMGINYPDDIVISMIEDALNNKYEIIIVPDDEAENNSEILELININK